MWAVCTPVAFQWALHTFALFTCGVWDFTQGYIFRLLKAIWHAYSTMMLGNCAFTGMWFNLHCVCEWNWGLGFLTIWSFDEMIALRKDKSTETTTGIKSLGGVASAVEGHSSLLIDAFLLSWSFVCSFITVEHPQCARYWAGNVVLIIVLTTSFLNQILLILSECQFLWYKYSRQGWFQAINIVTLNMELGRDASSELVQAHVHSSNRVPYHRHCR